MILDFALIMFVALVITGVVWAVDHVFWAKGRTRRAEELMRAFLRKVPENETRDLEPLWEQLAALLESHGIPQRDRDALVKL